MSMIKDSLCLPATGVDGDWIVKFPGSRFEDLPEVEHATMAWAAAAGFDVPEHRVVAASDLEGIDASWCEGSPTVYAIRRFDRSPGRRIHMEDFCQALALPPRYKYDGAGGGPVSFEGALLFATDLCGQEAGREMARRLGFVIASGNSDAHLKNWSIVWNDEGAAHLAPLYDQVATIAWETMGWSLRGGPNLALRIVGEARLRMLDATNLRHLGQRTGLSWAPDEVMNGVEASARAWSAVASGAPARLRNALVQHWKEVPLLRRWGSLPE
jgi:serine/threonine-protein kinase HipA